MSIKSYRKIRHLRLSVLAGLLLVVIGLILFGVSLITARLDERSVSAAQPFSQTLKSANPANNPGPTISGTPIHISVPSVGIDVKVIPGYYYPKSDSWTLSSTNAQYAVMTEPANNKSGLT